MGVILSFTHTYAQDTLRPSGNAPDSSTRNLLAQDNKASKPKFNPRLATIRSAIIPGWGQAYNRRYWKIPIIYGALGVTTATFIYNIKFYKLLKTAYTIRVNKDTSRYGEIDPRFVNLSDESIRSYRNEFRQNVDYSVLFFLLFWGLNVVDATVDAHLKGFDVNENLNVKIKPRYDPIGKVPSLSFVLSFRDKHAVTAPPVH
jgi:hypothetical protein